MSFTTTAPVGVSQTGQVVYLGQMDVAHTQVMIVVSSTVLAAAATTVLMTVFQGITQTTAGVTSWSPPAGKTFRLLSLQAAFATSVALTAFATAGVFVSTASVTVGPTAVLIGNVQAFVPAGGTVASILGMAQDVPIGASATTQIAMGVSASGSTARLLNIVAVGYLFP
jgi:hypothetical protein